VAFIAGVAIALGQPAAASAAKPSFEATAGDQLLPGFAWNVRTYAARCGGGTLDLRIDGARGWRVRTAARKRPRGGDIRVHVPLDEGAATTIAFRRRDGTRQRRFWVRCLPRDFVEFSFERLRKGGAKLFFVKAGGYVAIFSRDGAPVWWLRTDGGADAKLLPDGTVSMNAEAGLAAGPFEIRTLGGRLLRTVGDPGDTDIHDLQLLANGNYVIGAMKFRRGIDATPYGGHADAAVADTVIRELTPDGAIVRSWDSGQHIGLAEAGRWWTEILAQPDALWYDVSHWNAVEVDGRYMYLSFRNNDAIYKVNRRTGAIVWKLGGTETPDSLEVRGDPAGYPLGGQHDVRVQPDGTVTIFNNRTDLTDDVARAQRFRIDEQAGTARLVETVTDPTISAVFCCGSARRLPSREWLISWGNNPVVGAYDRAGRAIYRLHLEGGFTYRANPVPGGVVGTRKLRRAMNRMYG